MNNLVRCFSPGLRSSQSRLCRSKASPRIYSRRVKRIGISLLLGLSLCSATVSGVTLAWDPNPEPNIVGYVIYSGQQSESYTQRIEVGNVTQTTISNLQPGITYYFAMTALNNSGIESDPSPEISYTVPSSGPARPRLLSISSPDPRRIILTWTSVPGSIYRVASKNDLSGTNWIDLSQNITATASTTSWIGPLSSTLRSKFFAIRLVSN
jgi:hypothetical protein